MQSATPTAPAPKGAPQPRETIVAVRTLVRFDGGVVTDDGEIIGERWSAPRSVLVKAESVDVVADSGWIWVSR